MPPKNACPNADLLAVVEDIKSQCKSDNLQHAWNRCAKSLQSHPTRITCKDDLLPLHGWGSKTSEQAWKKYTNTVQGTTTNYEPGPSRSGARTTASRSRPDQAKANKMKRSLDDSLEDFSHSMDLAAPLPKRSRPTTPPTVSGAASSQIPASSSQPRLPQPAPPINRGSASTVDPISPTQFDGFGFWYLNGDDCHVKSSDDAYIGFLDEGPMFKVEFAAIQANHPWVTAFIKHIQPKANGTCYGYVSPVVADVVTECPGIEISAVQKGQLPPVQPFRSHAVPLDQRASTSGGPSNSLLQVEFSKVKRKNNTLDPTRMLSAKSAADLAAIRAARPFPASSTRALDPRSSQGKYSVLLFKDELAIDIFAEIPVASMPTEHPSSSPIKTSPSRSNTTTPAAPAQVPQSGLKRLATTSGGVPGPSARRPVPRASNHIPAPRAVDELELELEDAQPGFTSNVYMSSNPSSFGNGGASTNDHIYSSAPAQSYLQPFQPYIFPAGSYSIFMVLDIREGRHSNEALIPDLEARGVNIERRALAIGDVAWIAVKTSVDGLGGPQECVLDFIVERKRMDDLVGSVKDGRFHEQKFRLKESGIGQVFYVVEHYQTSRHRENYDKMIDTTLSSTQIVDGFKVKETESLKETAAFLAQVHKTLLRIHQSRDLHIIPTSIIRRHSYTAMQKHLRDTQPDQAYLTTWDAFGALNAKSGLLTARECWARMLLCVSGLSPEKVAAIIELYETPKALWESFAAAEEEEEIERRREIEEEMARHAALGGKGKAKGRAKKSSVVPAKHMLTRMPNVSGRRKIGAALSEKVYELFRAQSY